MNKISKYVLYLPRISLLPSNILKHKYITQKFEFSTKKLPMFNFLSSYKITRQLSNINDTEVSNSFDTNDTLLISIKNAKQSSDILEMLRLHISVMNIQQHLQALNTLFFLQKSKNTNLSNEEITRSPEFTALCNKIQRYSRNLELNDLMNNVKCLSYLNISVNSNIMQMQLQLISKMINDMSLNQICFLQFLLKDLLPCPLVDALKIALPIVFEIQIKYKLEDNEYYLMEYLNYTTKYRLSQETFDFLISKIQNNFGKLNLEMVKSVLLNLYHIDYSTDKYINLINRCLQMYMNHLNRSSNILEIEAILTRMLNKYFKDSEVFYHEQFINTVVDHLITRKHSFEEIGYILKKLNKIGYVHPKLLDYVTNLLNENNTILEKCKIGLFLSYIAACTIANHVPPGFVQLKPHILKRIILQKDVLGLPWLLIAFDLAVLDCWSDDLLVKVFSRDFLFEFLKRSGNAHDYIMLLKLYQAAATMYPGGYKGILPPTEIIEKAINIYQLYNNDFPLKTALEHGLGGNDYVLTNIRSKLGHIIDHVIVMRPGGYPVSIKNNSKDDRSKLLLENIRESTDNLVICVQLYKSKDYVINLLNCLKGSCVLTNKTIESLGVVMLPISMDIWNELMDYEKIPYIMRELKSKTENDSIRTNLVH